MEPVVVPDDFPPILSGTQALNRLRQLAPVMVYTEKASSQEELIQRLRGCKVVVNIRASEKTKGLVSRQALKRVKPSCILVNTARASIVDTEAMMEALRTGRLAAASLDVFDQEPLSANDPILSLPNVVLSPHNSGMTPEAIEKGNEMVVENVISFLQGRLINLVIG